MNYAGRTVAAGLSQWDLSGTGSSLILGVVVLTERRWG